MVEGRCGSSSAPVVALGIHCLSILAGHVPSNQVAVVVGTVLATLTVPGTALVALDTALTDTGSVVLDTALVNTGLVALGPERIAQTDIGDSSLFSASAELKPMPCHQ